MDVIYSVIEHGATLFDAVIPIVFLNILFEKNNRIRKRTYQIGMVFMTLLNVIFVFALDGKDMVQALAMIVIEWGYAAVFLEGKRIKQLVCVLIYEAVLMLSSMVVVYGMGFFFSLDFGELTQQGNTYRVVTLIFNKILIVFLLFLITLLQKQKKQEYGEWKTALGGYAAVVLIEVSIIQFTKQQYFIKNTTVALMFRSTLALLGIGIILAICIYRLNRQYQYKLENKILTAKLEEEKYMIQKMNEMYEDNQILRHDLRRYLVIAQGMLQHDEIDDLRDYLTEILDGQFGAEQIYHTNSSMVNSVLNDRANICHKNRISYNVKVAGTISEMCQINISIILSNLIDNAIEAELKERVREIHVEILPYKNMLQLKVENYISTSVLKENPELKTKKANRARHGIGIKSVKKMVENMDGTYLCEERGDYFVTTILLPDDANCA